MSKRAERIEMRKRKAVDTYLYEPGISELTDDTVQHSNVFTFITKLSRESFQSPPQEWPYLLTPCDMVTRGISAT